MSMQSTELTSDEHMSIDGLADFVIVSKRATTNRVRRAAVSVALFVALLAHLESFVAGGYEDVELARRVGLFVAAVWVATRVIQELYLFLARRALTKRLTAVLSDLVVNVDVEQILATRRGQE